MGDDSVALLGPKFLEFLPWYWTFILLNARFIGLFLFLPGLGGGAAGLAIRYPAVLALSWASMRPEIVQAVPVNQVLIGVAILSELALGTLIGFVPRLVVAGVNAAGQQASSAMGLNAGQMIDPTTNTQSSDIGRILGDLATILFIFTGGHHAMVYLASGMAIDMAPGTFVVNSMTVDYLIRQTGHVITLGVLLSAPVVVALLLVQLVMGLISKAVSTVNVFVVSFPITVGVGLIILMFSVAGMIRMTEGEFMRLERSLADVIRG